MATLQERLIAKYGNPMSDQQTFEQRHMMLLKYPKDIVDNIPVLGASVYCNKDFAGPYLEFLRLLIRRGLHKEIRTNDQCFMVRYIRGQEHLKNLSIHSWGMAIDFNIADNPLGMTRLQALAVGLKPFSEQFFQAIRDADFVCGADFPRKDLMHLEFTKHI